MKRQIVTLVAGMVLGMTAQAQTMDPAAITAANSAFIETYNDSEILPLKNESKLLSEGKAAHYACGLFGMSKQSQLADGKVVIRYAIGGYDVSKKGTTYSIGTKTHPALAITIENKTDEYIYVDLSKCTVSCLDKVMKPKYTNEKLLLIGPKEKKDIQPVMLMEGIIFYTKGINKINFTLPGQVPCLKMDNGLKQAERLTWTSANSPLTITSTIVYDTTPKMTNPVSLTSTLYMKQMVGEASKQLIGGSKDAVWISNDHNLDIRFNVDDDIMGYSDPEKTSVYRIK